MRVSDYSKQIALVICCFISIFYALSATGHYNSMITKRNRHITGATSKKNIIRWLCEGAGIYLFNRYRPTWKRGVLETLAEQKEQSDLFQYRLQIEHITDTDPQVHTNHNRPTIYFHGWGDVKNSAKLLKAFCDVLPGDIVTFHFRDRGLLIPKFRYANLGQLPDVLSAIYTLKWTTEKLHPEAIDLFGYSRGGATLLNAIAVLNDTTGQFDAELSRIGVTNAMRKQLLSLIQKGCHVLNCPLTDMNVTMNEFIKDKMGSFAQRSMPFLMQTFEKLTHYKSTGMQGIASAQAFSNLKLNILLHFQYHDTIISNKNDVLLYETLYQHNPKTTFLVLGNDGGHIHSHEALAHTIHNFKKRFGSSYDPEYVLQYKTTKPILPKAQRLLCPGKKARTIIDAYYAQCAASNPKKSSLKKRPHKQIVQTIEE